MLWCHVLSFDLLCKRQGVQTQPFAWQLSCTRPPGAAAPVTVAATAVVLHLLSLQWGAGPVVQRCYGLIGKLIMHSCI